MTNTDLLTTVDELERHYDAPRATSLSKQSNHLTPAMQKWLSYSTFFILNTCSEKGLDCSPRGDTCADACRVIDKQTLAIPDRRGNNRIDTLRNLIKDPRIGALFIIPGVDQTLRIKGLASISVSPTHLELFAIDDALPSTVLLIRVSSAYIQNARAIRQAGLWDASTYIRTNELPSVAALSRVSTQDERP